MAVIECEFKGAEVYCPKCGRANPDVCLLEEMKEASADTDNGGPPLDEPVEAAGSLSEFLAMSIPEGIKTPTSEAPVAKISRRGRVKS